MKIPSRLQKKACADVTASKNALTSRFTRALENPQRAWRWGWRLFYLSADEEDADASGDLFFSWSPQFTSSVCLSTFLLPFSPPSLCLHAFFRRPLQRQGTSGDAFIKEKHWVVLTVFVESLVFCHQLKILQNLWLLPGRPGSAGSESAQIS